LNLKLEGAIGGEPTPKSRKSAYAKQKGGIKKTIKSGQQKPGNNWEITKKKGRKAARTKGWGRKKRPVKGESMKGPNSRRTREGGEKITQKKDCKISRSVGVGKRGKKQPSRIQIVGSAEKTYYTNLEWLH